MKKKGLIVAIIVALIVAAVILVAGSKNNKPEEPNTKSTETKSEEKPEPEPVVTEEPAPGGNVNTASEKAALPEDLQQVFDQAAGQFNGPSQQAVAYLGSQVVSGSNHAYLTQDVDGDHNFHVMIAYQDLDGNVELKSVSDVDPTAASYGANTESGEAGGWTVAENTYSSVPADATEALDAAISQTNGSSATPVALLSTQVVSGVNYSILCKTAPVTPDASESLQVVHVYKDASNNSEITEYVPFSLADFNQ